MTTEHELLAALAERIAHAADRAAADGDEARLLRATDKLLDLIGRLPLRDPEGGASDDGGAGGSVRELFSGVPSLGHGAHS